MDSERPNEHTSWSSRLEQPGALPGTGLTDKETAWDKLYERLQDARKTSSRRNVARFPGRSNVRGLRRTCFATVLLGRNLAVTDNEPQARSAKAPRRRRMIWFRAAAACLLLIAIPAVLLIKDRYKGLGKTPSPIPVATSSGREHTTLKDERSAPTAVPAVTAPSHPTVSRDPTLASHLPDLRAPGTSALTRTPALSAHGSSGQPAHPIMTRPGLNKLLTHGADTLTLVFTRPDLSKPITVTAAAPLKKEQRVVHINELEPQQPTPATVKGPRQKPGSLRIGLGPEESYRPATSYIEPETHSILNLKHAQNP